MAVVSMSKQEFSRLEVLLQVQSGRLRVADACELIGLQRRQVFRLLRGLKQDGATSLLRSAAANPAITVRRPKFVVLHCRPCATDTPTSARPWRRRSWQNITAVRCRVRPCAVG